MLQDPKLISKDIIYAFFFFLPEIFTVTPILS